MYLVRGYLGLSLKEIGSYFGGKDHTTVMHGVAKVKDMKDRDQSFAAHLEGLTKAISRG
jgi:chromosomal replication initiator protein